MNLSPLKLLVVSILYFSFITICIAQNARLSGQITDQSNGEPLINATIQHKNGGTITDLDGHWQLELPAGTHYLEVNYLGFQSLYETVELAAGEEKVFHFQMEASPTILQTATVTSGRYEKPIGEVTVSMEVLKPALIKAVNATSIDEILDKMPGVNMIDGQANIRGGSGWSYGAGSRVLLLIDDIPALQPDAGFPNWDDVPIETAEQVEIVKGAASALYGSSALNGIINFRTAYAKSKPETTVAAFYGPYLAPKDKAKKSWTGHKFQTGLNVLHKQKINKLDLVLSGFGLWRESVKEFNFSRYARLTIGSRYRITDKLSVGFNSNFNRGKSASFFYWRDSEEGIYLADTTSISNSKKNRFTIDPFVTYFDNDGNRHKLISRFYKIINDNDGNQSNGSKLFYGEYQFQRKWEDIELVTTAGLVSNTTQVAAELYGDTTYHTNNYAGYIQLDKKLFGKLNVNAGMRYESYTQNSPESVVLGRDTVFIEDGKSRESKPVFRFGINLQATKETFFRASWGQGYRFPTIAEKFISTNAGGVIVLPNPDLTSETGWSAEFGLKQGYQISKWQGYLDIAAFWSEYQDMMEFSFDPTLFGFQSRNVGSTIIKGMEVSVVGQGLFLGLPSTLLTGYTFINPKFKQWDARPIEPGQVPTEGQINYQNSSSENNILKYRHQHTFKFDMESNYRSFSLGLAAIYNSHMEAIDKVLAAFIPGLATYRENNTDGSLRIDGRMAYRFAQGTKASFLINNIFNQEILTRPGQVQSPRHIQLKVEHVF